MLNAASAMDAAILVVAANEECPRPQTAEHLAAADLMNLGRYVVIQNKVDLVSEENARKSYLDIRGFTQGTGAEVISQLCQIFLYITIYQFYWLRW
jgi:translation initiation factor 2 subunit 3